MVPSGESSVMPQARLHARLQPHFHPADERIGTGGAADEHAFEARHVLARRIEMIQQTQPHRLHTDRDRDTLGTDQPSQPCTVGVTARKNHPGADGRGCKRNAPAIGVEQRHGDENAVCFRQRHRVGLQRAQRMQIVRTMGVKHAFGRAGRAGCVAEPGGGILAEIAPDDVPAQFGKQRFEGEGPAPVDGPHVGAVEEHDRPDAGAKRCHLFRQLRQSGADREHAVFRFVHDGREMANRQARIEGVADEACAHRAVIDFEMMLRVPGQRRDAIAEIETEGRESA